MAEKKKKILALAIATCTGFVIFVNHYARDVPGALEKQLEDSLITSKVYSTMNALYFLPNIFAPMTVGYLIEVLGSPERLLLFSMIIGSCGHFLFAYGAEGNSVPLLLFGRCIAGISYEVIDSIPVVILAPLFKVCATPSIITLSK